MPEDSESEEQNDEWLDSVFDDGTSEHEVRHEASLTDPPDEDEDKDEGEEEVETNKVRPASLESSTENTNTVQIKEHEQTILDKIEELQEMDSVGGGHSSGGEDGAKYIPVASSNDVSYIPVSSSKMARLQTRLDEGIAKCVNGKRLGWWYPDTLMGAAHPFLLINPMTMSGSIQRENFARDHMEANRGEVFVMGDSGGYQIANANGLEVTHDLAEHDGKNYIHPQRIIEWQVANADVGTMLDTPPYSYSKSEGKFQEETWENWYQQTFKSSLEVSTKNTEIMLDRLEEIGHDGFDFMAIMHGIPRQDGSGPITQAHDEWFEAIDSLYDWDAWSLALGSADNPGLLTFGMGYFMDRTEFDIFHALGQGNAWARILCKLYAQLTDTFVTHDGTGFKMGSLFSEVHVPSTYLDTVQMSDRDGDGTVDHGSIDPLRMPCGCTVCRQVDKSLGADTLFDERKATEWSVVMDLHNLEHLIRRFRLIDAYIEDRGKDIMDDVLMDEGTGEVQSDSVFWNLLADWFSESRVLEIYYAMDFLIMSSEGDFDEACEKYTINSHFYDTSKDVAMSGASPSIARQRAASVFNQW